MKATLRNIWLDKPSMPLGNGLYVVIEFPQRSSILAFNVGSLNSIKLSKKFLDNSDELDVKCLNVKKFRQRIREAQAQNRKGQWKLLLQALLTFRKPRRKDTDD